MNNQPICSFKERLRQALDERNMKQIELSEKTKIAKGSINHYLSGYSEPKADKLYIIAKALNVSEVWLMGYDVPMVKEHPNPFNTDNVDILLDINSDLELKSALEKYFKADELTKKKVIDMINVLCG